MDNREKGAFASSNGLGQWRDGLTKKEYAAIHILQGLCSRASIPADMKEMIYEAANGADALFDELERKDKE